MLFQESVPCHFQDVDRNRDFIVLVSVFVIKLCVNRMRCEVFPTLVLPTHLRVCEMPVAILISKEMFHLLNRIYVIMFSVLFFHGQNDPFCACCVFDEF